MTIPIIGHVPLTRLKLLYVNYKGEEAWRDVTILSLHWGSTQWHAEPQLLLEVYDHEKTAHRTFAAKDVRDVREP